MARRSDSSRIVPTGALLACLLAGAAAPRLAAEPPPRGYRIERGELAMADGVALAATYFLPEAREPGERFPVLLELLPYRKDDSFYLRDLPHHAAWARRGFASVKVDLRGTGGSEGRVPEREYSEAELDDGVEIVRQLAAMPWSNGRVAMWGISWGGFNAYRVALRRPPGLAAILAVHASDDLWRDSIDWLDGILHLDPYHLQIHHENALPATPDYPLDEAFFRDRFDVRPWLFDYVAASADGPFWRPGVRLDRGYRDFPFRLLERAQANVRAEVGPWNHDWPHGGEPGPNYEWLDGAERFLRRFLTDGEAPDPADKGLLLFFRAGHAPGGDLPETPGRWIEARWPIPGTAIRRFHATGEATLAETPPGRSGGRRLLARAGSGTAAGLWWGEPTGDLAGDDGESLVFDSAPLERPLAVAGFAHVSVGAVFDAPEGRIVARLEDVAPDGRVALVTGAALDARERQGSEQPLAVRPHEPLALAFDLHATTWTFRPGHRIRLALSTAQFPMLWPAAHWLTLTVRTGGDDDVSQTWLELPEIPPGAGTAPSLPPPQGREARTDAAYERCGEGPEEVERVVRDLAAGTTRYEIETACAWTIGERRYRSHEQNRWQVEDDNPANASYSGRESHTIELEGGRRLRLETTIDLTSDATALHLAFTRRISENGRLVREREWRERYPRRP